MNLHQNISGAANDGNYTFCNGNVDGYPFIAYGSGNEIIILDKTFNQIQTVTYPQALKHLLICLDCSKENGKIIASYGDLVLVLEPIHAKLATDAMKIENGPPWIYEWVIQQQLVFEYFVNSLSMYGDYLLTAGTSITMWHFSSSTNNGTYHSDNNNNKNNNNNNRPKFQTRKGSPESRLHFSIGEADHEETNLSEEDTQYSHPDHMAQNESNTPNDTINNKSFQHGIFEIVWKTESPNPVKLIEFSPDGQYFASSHQDDSLLRIWFHMPNLSNNHSDNIDYQYTYLYHPKPIIGFEWRQTSHYMPRGTVPNILLTTCADNMIRIWREECVLSDIGVTTTSPFSLHSPDSSDNPDHVTSLKSSSQNNPKRPRGFSQFAFRHYVHDQVTNEPPGPVTNNDPTNNETHTNGISDNEDAQTETTSPPHQAQLIKSPKHDHKFKLLKYLKHLKKKIHSLELCHLPSGHVFLRRSKTQVSQTDHPERTRNDANFYHHSEPSSFGNFIKAHNWAGSTASSVFPGSINLPLTRKSLLDSDEETGYSSPTGNLEPLDGVKFQFNLVTKLDNIDKDFSAFLSLHWLNNKEFHFTLRSEKILLLLMKHSQKEPNVTQIVNSYENNIRNLSTSSTYESKSPKIVESPEFNNASSNSNNEEETFHGHPSHHTNINGHSEPVPDIKVNGQSKSSTEKEERENIFRALELQVIREIELLLKDWHQNCDILYSIHPFNGDLLFWKIEWIDEFQPGQIQIPKLSFLYFIPNAFVISKLDLEKGFKERTCLFTDHSLLLQDMLTTNRWASFMPNSVYPMGGFATPNLHPYNHEYSGIHLQTENWSRSYFDNFPLYCVTNNKEGNLNLWILNYVGKEFEIPRVINVEHKAEVLGHTFPIIDICSHPTLPLLLSASQCEIIIWKLRPIGPLGISGGLTELATKKSLPNLYDTPYDRLSPSKNPRTKTFNNFAWLPHNHWKVVSGDKNIHMLNINFIGLEKNGHSLHFFRIQFPEIDAIETSSSPSNKTGPQKSVSFNTIPVDSVNRSNSVLYQSNRFSRPHSLEDPTAKIEPLDLIISYGKYIKEMQGYTVKFFHVYDLSTMFDREPETESVKEGTSKDAQSKKHKLTFYIVLILTNNLNPLANAASASEVPASDQKFFDKSFENVTQNDPNSSPNNETSSPSIDGITDSDKILMWSIKYDEQLVISKDSQGRSRVNKPIVEFIGFQNIYNDTITFDSQSPEDNYNNNNNTTIQDDKVDKGTFMSHDTNIKPFKLPHYVSIISASPFINPLYTRSPLLKHLVPQSFSHSSQQPLQQSSSFKGYVAPYLISLACSDGTIRFIKCQQGNSNGSCGFTWYEWNMPHMYRTVKTRHLLDNRGTSAIKLQYPAIVIAATSFPGGRVACIVPDGTLDLDVIKAKDRFKKFKVLIFECESSGGSDWILEDKIPLILHHLQGKVGEEEDETEKVMSRRNPAEESSNSLQPKNEKLFKQARDSIAVTLKHNPDMAELDETEYDEFYENPQRYINITWVSGEDGSHLLFLLTRTHTHPQSMLQQQQHMDHPEDYHKTFYDGRLLSVYAYFPFDSNDEMLAGDFINQYYSTGTNMIRYIFGNTNPNISKDETDFNTKWKLIYRIGFPLDLPDVKLSLSPLGANKKGTASRVLGKVKGAWIREGAYVLAADHSLKILAPWNDGTSNLLGSGESNKLLANHQLKDASKQRASEPKIQAPGLSKISSYTNIGTMEKKRKKSSITIAQLQGTKSAAAGLSKLGSRSNLPGLLKSKDDQEFNYAESKLPSLRGRSESVTPTKLKFSPSKMRNNFNEFKAFIYQPPFLADSTGHDNNPNIFEIAFKGTILPQYHPKQLVELLNCGQIDTVILVLGYITRFLSLSERSAALAASRSKIEHVSLQGTRNRAASMAISSIKLETLNESEPVTQATSRKNIRKKEDIFFKLPDTSGDIGFFEVESIPPLPMFVFLTLHRTFSDDLTPKERYKRGPDENDCKIVTRKASISYMNLLRRHLSTSPETTDEEGLIGRGRKLRDRSQSIASNKRKNYPLSRSRSRSKSISLMNKKLGLLDSHENGEMETFEQRDASNRSVLSDIPGNLPPTSNRDSRKRQSANDLDDNLLPSKNLSEEDSTTPDHPDEDKDSDSKISFGSKEVALLSQYLSRISLPEINAHEQMQLLALADTVAWLISKESGSAAAVDNKEEKTKSISSPSNNDQPSDITSPPSVTFEETNSFEDSTSTTRENKMHNSPDNKQEKLDGPGLRYCLAMRQFNYMNLRNAHTSKTNIPDPSFDDVNWFVKGKKLMKSSAFAWAFHSKNQDICLKSIPPFRKGKYNWDEFRRFGCGWWIRDKLVLQDIIEKIARNAFQRNRDPLDAALFYILLHKKNILQGLFKSVSNQRMYEFFKQNFDEEKARRAAARNAFVLISKHKYKLAVAFFLLSKSLNDAIQVCLKNLMDIQLALVVCKLFVTDEELKKTTLLSRLSLTGAPEENENILFPVKTPVKMESQVTRKVPGSLIGFGRRPGTDPQSEPTSTTNVDSNTNKNDKSESVSSGTKPLYNAGKCELEFIRLLLTSDPLFHQLYLNREDGQKLVRPTTQGPNILDLPLHIFSEYNLRRGDPFILSICFTILGQDDLALNVFLDTLAPPKYHRRKSSNNLSSTLSDPYMESSLMSPELDKESSKAKLEQLNKAWLKENDHKITPTLPPLQKSHKLSLDSKNEPRKKSFVKFDPLIEQLDEKQLQQSHKKLDDKERFIPSGAMAGWARKRMSSITETREPPSSFFLSMDRMFDITAIFNFYQYLKRLNKDGDKVLNTLNPRERHLYFACAYTYVKIGCPILALEVLNRLSNKNILDKPLSGNDGTENEPKLVIQDDSILKQLKWCACLKIMTHELMTTFGSTTFCEADEIDSSNSESSDTESEEYLGDIQESPESSVGPNDNSSQIISNTTNNKPPINIDKKLEKQIKTTYQILKKIDRTVLKSSRVWLRFYIWLEKEINALTKFCVFYDTSSPGLLSPSTRRVSGVDKVSQQSSSDPNSWLMAHKNILRTLFAFLCLHKPVGTLSYVKLELAMLLAMIFDGSKTSYSSDTEASAVSRDLLCSTRGVYVINELPYLVLEFFVIESKLHPCKTGSNNSAVTSATTSATNSPLFKGSIDASYNTMEDESSKLLVDQSPLAILRDSCKDIMVSILDLGFGTCSDVPPGLQVIDMNSSTYTELNSSTHLRNIAAPTASSSTSNSSESSVMIAFDWNRLLATQDASHSLSMCIYQSLTPLNPLPQKISNQQDYPPDSNVDGQTPEANRNSRDDRKSVEEIHSDILDKVKNTSTDSRLSVHDILQLRKSFVSNLSKDRLTEQTTLYISPEQLDTLCNSEFDVILNFWWKYYHSPSIILQDNGIGKERPNGSLFRVVKTDNPLLNPASRENSSNNQIIIDPGETRTEFWDDAEMHNWPCLTNDLFWRELRLFLAECLLAIHASCFLTALATYDAFLLYRITCLKLNRNLWRQSFGYCIDAYVKLSSPNNANTHSKKTTTLNSKQEPTSTSNNANMSDVRTTSNTKNAKLFIPPTKPIFARIFQKTKVNDGLPIDVLDYESDESSGDVEDNISSSRDSDSDIEDDEHYIESNQHRDPNSFSWTLIRLACVRAVTVEVGTFLNDVLASMDIITASEPHNLGQNAANKLDSQPHLGASESAGRGSGSNSTETGPHLPHSTFSRIVSTNPRIHSYLCLLEKWEKGLAKMLHNFYQSSIDKPGVGLFDARTLIDALDVDNDEDPSHQDTKDLTSKKNHSPDSTHDGMISKIRLFNFNDDRSASPALNNNGPSSNLEASNEHETTATPAHSTLLTALKKVGSKGHSLNESGVYHENTPSSNLTAKDNKKHRNTRISSNHSLLSKYKIILDPNHTPFRSESRSVLPIKRLWLRLVRDGRTHDLFVKFIFLERKRYKAMLENQEREKKKDKDASNENQTDFEIHGGGGTATKISSKGNFSRKRHSIKTTPDGSGYKSSATDDAGTHLDANEKSCILLNVCIPSSTTHSTPHSHKLTQLTHISNSDAGAIHCFAIRSKLLLDFDPDQYHETFAKAHSPPRAPAPLTTTTTTTNNTSSSTRNNVTNGVGKSNSNDLLKYRDNLHEFFGSAEEYYFYPRKDALAIASDRNGLQELDIHQALNKSCNWMRDNDLQSTTISSPNSKSQDQEFLIVPSTQFDTNKANKLGEIQENFNFPTNAQKYHIPLIHTLVKRPAQGIRKMAAHPLQDFYMTGSYDGVVQIWKWGRVECLTKLPNINIPSSSSSNSSAPNPGARVVNVSYSPQGTKLGVMYLDGHTMLYNSNLESYLHSDAAYWNAQCHSKYGTDFTFIGSCTLLATSGFTSSNESSSGANNICVFDTLLPERSSCVRALNITDDIVNLTNTHSQSASQTTTGTGSSAVITALEYGGALMPHLIVATTKKGRIILIDIRNPAKILNSFPGLDTNIRSLGVDDTLGEYMATGAVNGNIKVWSLSGAFKGAATPNINTQYHTSSPQPIYTYDAEHHGFGAGKGIGHGTMFSNKLANVINATSTSSSSSSSISNVNQYLSFLGSGGVTQLLVDGRHNLLYSSGYDGSFKVRKLPDTSSIFKHDTATVTNGGIQ